MNHHQYLVYLSAGLYYATDSNGAVISSGADAATVIQNVVNQNPSGIIALGAGTFNLSTSIKLQNNRSYTFVGSGSNLDSFNTGTILSAGNTVNAKVFEIVDSGIYNWSTRFVTLEKMRLTAPNGYGIHCDFPAHTTNNAGKVSPRFVIRDVMAYCKFGFLINIPINMHFNNVRGYSEVSGSRFIWLKNTNTGNYHCGNSEFFGLYAEMNAPDSVGLYLDQTGGTGWLNEMTFVGVMFLTADSGGGMAGIWLNCRGANAGSIALTNFYDTRIEGFTNAILMTARDQSGGGRIFKSCFTNHYSWSQGGQSGSDVLASGQNSFYDVVIQNANTDGVINLSGVTGTGGTADTPTFNVLNCKCGGGVNPPAAFTSYNLSGDGVNIKTSFSKTVTAVAGVTAVTHELKLGPATAQRLTPNVVQVTPYDSGITSLYVSSQDATNINVVCTPAGRRFTVNAWYELPRPWLA